jgi:K(+)-stimulated pyrophosphate-energized sodium pump
VGKTSLTGAATVVLAGVSVGLESAVYTAIVIAAAVYGAFLLGGSGVVGLFAIALAGCGLLTTVGVIVAMDTFGPVSDNAQGIAEMSGDVHGDGTQILTELDAVGNTTKAITKGLPFRLPSWRRPPSSAPTPTRFTPCSPITTTSSSIKPSSSRRKRWSVS